MNFDFRECELGIVVMVSVQLIYFVGECLDWIPLRMLLLLFMLLPASTLPLQYLLARAGCLALAGNWFSEGSKKSNTALELRC